ncbi:MAG: CHASE2 domain-containing protein [Nanobdellota archaeon]
MKTGINKQKIIPALSGIFIIIISLIFFMYHASSESSFFKTLDEEITNIMFRIRGEEKASDEIVIIDIDEKSIKNIGQWPWSRDVVAELINKINQKKASVIGLDIFFPEKDRTSPENILKKFNIKLPQKKLPDYDKMLGDAVAASDSVMGYMFDFKNSGEKNCCPFTSASVKITGDKIKFSDLYLNDAKNTILNIPETAASITEGFLNFFPESSGVIKKVPLLIKYGNIPYPSLALELYRLHTNTQWIKIVPSEQKAGGKNTVLGIYAGSKFIPTDIDAQMFINFRGKQKSYKYISASDILNNKNTDLENKIVIIGTSAPGLSDLKATPFSPSFPGVEIHATIIDNILNSNFLKYDRYTETGITYFILCAGGLVITFLLIYSGPLFAGLITFLTITASFFINYFFLFSKNIIAGFSYPGFCLAILCVTVTILNYFFREREKKFIHNAFSHYVSPDVVNELIKNPEKLTLSGETKEVTIMFADIRGFTEISESTQPKLLGELLNGYFTEISDIIRKNKGLVDKFIGDAVMAFWNAPVENKSHSFDSVISAFQIFDELKRLNIDWHEKNFPLLKLGIGINTGEASVGNFGSNDRFDYTVIGDSVNLASRIEGLNKFYKTDLLITEFTQKNIENKILSRKIDLVKVKGKNRPVQIFEPVAVLPCDSRTEDETHLFNEAFDYYIKGNFSDSKKIMEKLFKNNPLFIYELYIERIKTLILNTPENWDGVFQFKEK